jgi:hypothetical protein
VAENSPSRDAARGGGGVALQEAPDFELPDHLVRPWGLAAALARGPVLVVFYRGDW